MLLLKTSSPVFTVKKKSAFLNTSNKVLFSAAVIVPIRDKRCHPEIFFIRFADISFLLRLLPNDILLAKEAFHGLHFTLSA